MTGGRNELHEDRPVLRVVALLASCGWIAAIVVARRGTNLATDDQSLAMSVAAAVVIGVSFVAATLLLSGVLLAGGAARRRDGALVAGILFSVTISGLIADGRLVAWDAAAGFLALAGATVVLWTPSRWIGALLIGAACGLAPLCASALSVLLLVGRGGHRIAGALAAVVVGVGVCVVIQSVTGRTPGESLTVGDDVMRIGPQNLWRFVASWLDLVTPVLVLALIAAADRFFSPEAGDTDDAASDVSQPDGISPGRYTGAGALTVWLAVNAAVALLLSRAIVGHGFLLVLPAFLLAAAGWRAVCCLPFDRSDLTLSLFSALCRAMPFALLWVPFRKAGEIVLVAWYGS